MDNANQYTNPVVPTFQQTEVPQLRELTQNAFRNSLLSVILSQFPVASIIAIFKGSKGQKLAKEAESMAAAYGISAGGKNVAAKIMGLVGKILGIVNTVGYAVYAMIWMFEMLLFVIMLLENR